MQRSRRNHEKKIRGIVKITVKLCILLLMLVIVVEGILVIPDIARVPTEHKAISIANGEIQKLEQRGWELLNDKDQKELCYMVVAKNVNKRHKCCGVQSAQVAHKSNRYVVILTDKTKEDFGGVFNFVVSCNKPERN